MCRLHYVNLYYDADSKYYHKKNKALPGSLHVAGGDGIKFIASNSNYRVFIPEADLIFDNVEPDHMFFVSNGDLSDQLNVKQGKISEPIKIKYTAYCESGKDFVEGDSSPRIIVE